MSITRVVMDISTSTALHKQGVFDMDSNAIYRSLLVIGLLAVIIAVWIVIKILRVRNNEMRIRRYDILPAKQLVLDHIDSEDSDDELFAPVRRDDSTRHLIPENTL
ncbi:hypothetical protein, variant [Loa loa]|uniref:Uncharacterized protein n=2 Tax=Loa loa TaxID=7209 RepID=A0A1S0U2R6_LOALO|nr:hypothetical protein LOAG_04146 [Loa loa]XP_020306496.1 hypothetical protein, variant [Loa loa]EFO24331.1 hypothetical protein LOAG_04146 [Loa loa]EJD75647.1 hypothetical protein, variant [Loa loa]